MPTYKTTSAQREQLLTDGYVLLPGAVSAPILNRWQKLADRLEEEALAAHARSEQIHGACVIGDRGEPLLIRYDDIVGFDPDAVFELLASPGMMAVARDLCGRGTVPMQLDILFKHEGPGSVIRWHQGAPHPRGFPYLNVGFYLDDADAGDGCLRYVPGTQHELQDIPGLSEKYGWEPPGVVEQPAKAGDILVQDMMVLHGSQPKQKTSLRRTVYIEFRPVAGIHESGEQSERWAELRNRWMGLVLRRAEVSDWPDAWRADHPDDLGEDVEEVRPILEHAEPPIPAVYGERPVETEDYPFSSELRERWGDGF